ncbi:SGNH/GDSL hydrolase family protein [Erysipelothrix inopinata]|uniref:SGNH/GDSL hydrolase family protein n=1 Tax=Erysipelothrix inopinata TaxID=225084 RepID=A0A7G9RXJ1_9FIRM|nr:SGNH/GDSL hydrolase family protein [Erysipelothrix inopinata]QNN60316.1 SGNH/GDSL hydrolase family protein [Erysipelothrix inopinata]
MKKGKKLMKFILFVTILGLILLVLSKGFSVKEISGIESEKENSVDYLVLGDSEAYTSISPMEIWNERGYTGYNLGVSAQTLQRGLDVFQKAIENQKPKILLIESNFIFRNKGFINDAESFISTLFTNHFSIFNDHTNWKKMIKEGKLPSFDDQEFVSNPLKGYRYRFEVKPYTKGEYVNPTQNRVSVPTYQKFILDQIMEICNNNDIKVIFYSAPTPVNWGYSNHNTVADLAKEYGCEYVDLNLLTKQLEIDWNKDTYDAGDHLNFNGTLKVTKYISEYLSKNTNLEDLRHNSNYTNWEEDYQKYAEIIKAKKS